jgi:hypothetical protein
MNILITKEFSPKCAVLDRRRYATTTHCCVAHEELFCCSID